MKKLVLIMTVLASVSTWGKPTLNAGGDRGNGGDTYASEFVAAAYGILQWLHEHPVAEIKTESLALVILQTKVYSQDQLTLEGQTVDAINYPKAKPARIEINRQRWDQIRDDEYRQWRLVLHEYLPILGIDDRNYQVSRKLDSSQICERSIRAAIENNF